MNRRLLSALCFVMLAANAMGEEPVTFPDVEWEVRTPAEVGLDVAKLQELSAMVGGGRHRAQWVHGLQLARSERSQSLVRVGVRLQVDVFHDAFGQGPRWSRRD